MPKENRYVVAIADHFMKCHAAVLIRSHAAVTVRNVLVRESVYGFMAILYVHILESL